MRKVISFITAFALIFGCCACIVPLSSASGAENLTYTVTDGKACITGATGEIVGDFTVPAEIDGYPVTEIASYAFNKAKHKVTNMTISEGITKVGSRILPTNAEEFYKVYGYPELV